MDKVIIFGTNATAELAWFYLTHDSPYEPIGFCVDKQYYKSNVFCGLPVYAFEDFDMKNVCFFAPLMDNRLRAAKAKEISDKGYNLISYVSSKATCWSPVGKNCFILEDNTIQPFVQIGNNVIMWSGNHIGHHSKIEDNVFISSHVVICGKCTIKQFAWLGVNSSIRNDLTVTEGSLIGMAAAVCENTKPWHLHIGVPAKAVKDLRND